jgi:hypothetical protein
MKNNVDWKEYLKKDLFDGSYELGVTVSDIKTRAVNGWAELKKVIRDITEEKALKFKDELFLLLDLKLKEMMPLKISEAVFGKMRVELCNLLLCSLASERTPDEIIDGLADDPEMRKEVVSLLVNKVKRKKYLDNQHKYFDEILSGDDDLRRVLNAQTKKKDFPYNI